MKTYVLIVSLTFPATHKRKGEPMYFREKIWSALGVCSDKIYEEFGGMPTPKIHTIRANYSYWKKRIDQVMEGKAILSIRFWEGKPYGSKQIEICQLDKFDGVGIQKAELNFSTLVSKVDGNAWNQNIDSIAKNDGLSFEDFKEWFKGYDLKKPMAIVHFTPFRY